MASKQAISAALERVFERTPVETLDPNARYMLLSDLHKGQRDGADDFRFCEKQYLAALAYYYAEGFTLLLVGDAEELWECRPNPVFKQYDNVFRVERQFADAGRYRRIWGNHDDLWSHEDAVAKYLAPRLGQVRVVEAIRMRVDGDHEIFVVHGHQGTVASDKNSTFSRFVVRYLWRPFQRLTQVSPETPATHECLREPHDVAMYEWTLGHRGVVLIAGHTHRPVWTSQTHVEQMQAELEKLKARQAPAQEIAALERAIADRIAKDKYCMEEHRKRWPEPPRGYFNTGCCCFPDGNITGIEIDRGHMRLVRWSQKGTQAAREVRCEAPLHALFAQAQTTAVAPGVS